MIFILPKADIRFQGNTTMLKHTIAAAMAVAASCAVSAMPEAARADGIVVSPQIPYDVTLTPGMSGEDIQKAYNTYSWNMFFALNWPASDTMRGEPKRDGKLEDPGQRVWETFKDTTEIFTTPPTRPTPWNAWGEALPSYCPQDSSIERGRAVPVLSEIGKQAPVIGTTVQPMSGPLGYVVDQNGKKVWIDSRLNKTSFDFIYDNKYYDANVQNAARDNLLFPISGANASKTIGPVDIKAAWKVMGDGDDRSKFYTRTAYLVDAPLQRCEKVLVGLVALHYTVKTVTAPQWIWGTFEHKDNAPSCKTWDYTNPSATCQIDWKQAHYSFANPSCPNCAFNVLPAPPTANQPTQVVRIIPIPPAVEAFNSEAAGLQGVHGTVWANYELLDTQFPSDPTQIHGSPYPHALANALLETYSQGTTPWTQSSSCLGCHFIAPTTYQPFGLYFSDFVFQLSHAKPFNSR
jgi:hypothetical protein